MGYDYNKRESRPTEMSRKRGCILYGDGIRGRRVYMAYVYTAAVMAAYNSFVKRLSKTKRFEREQRKQ